MIKECHGNETVIGAWGHKRRYTAKAPTNRCCLNYRHGTGGEKGETAESA